MPKLDPYKYIEQDKKEWVANPGVSGVYHDSGWIYASDGSILIKIMHDYPRQYDGKLIGTDGKVAKKYFPDGGKMDEDAKPLKYESVIPSDKTIREEYHEYKVDIDSLEDLAKKASGKRRNTHDYDKTIAFQDDKGRMIAIFNPKSIRKAVDFMRWRGLHRILLHKELSSRPLLVYDGRNMLMLMPVFNAKTDHVQYRVSPSDNKINTNIKSIKIPTAMTRKRTTTKARRSANTTMREASRILKSQKEDYQRIFRSEVKKSKDPKKGAKKAGKIYRDRYGSTATARWKRAVRKANFRQLDS